MRFALGYGIALDPIASVRRSEIFPVTVSAPVRRMVEGERPIRPTPPEGVIREAESVERMSRRARLSAPSLITRRHTMVNVSAPPPREHESGFETEAMREWYNRASPEQKAKCRADFEARKASNWWDTQVVIDPETGKAATRKI